MRCSVDNHHGAKPPWSILRSSGGLMANNPRPGNRYWQLPGDVIAYPCAIESCMEIATILVQDGKEIETPLCTNDWHALQRQEHGRTEIVRTLERPICFHGDCRDKAVTVMEHLDGTPFPVCRRHWDDLTWVRPNEPGCTPPTGDHRGITGWQS